MGAEAADYFHLSVIDEDGGESSGIPAPIDESLANRYLWYLEIGRGAFARAIGILADAANYPIVFHCAAGKDRTGVLAALILDIVGVERRAIVEDYVLTASRMDAIQRHGGARQWALAAGVPYDAVEALSTLLVSTAPVPRDVGR